MVPTKFAMPKQQRKYRIGRRRALHREPDKFSFDTCDGMDRFRSRCNGLGLRSDKRVSAPDKAAEYFDLRFNAGIRAVRLDFMLPNLHFYS